MLVCELGAHVDATSRDGFSAAHVAARYDAADALARFLIEELGASSDLRSRSGDGPVHVAARTAASGRSSSSPAGRATQ